MDGGSFNLRAIRDRVKFCGEAGAQIFRLRAMLRKLSREVSDCYAQAHACAEKARSSPSADLREGYLRIEQSWLALARSYEFGERIQDFSKENDRRHQRIYAAEPFFCVVLCDGKWVINGLMPRPNLWRPSTIILKR